ncbi:MAG: galactose-1-phosphate uridylyltransferase [Candidatus Omnitrophota bacterium]|nr:galactose-1-phosphate uridylyltransferase [Candidatus Omnitrophota bacterium]
MPELRENLATKRWVIIATERAKRPEEFINKKEIVTHPAYDPKCPFCEGNEAANTGEVLAYRQPGSKVDEKGWHLRVVPNKYPALIEPTGPPAEVKRSKSGIYLRMEGVGKHEVVVESPIHNKTIATMSIDEVERVITAYRDRYLSLDWDPHYKLIIIFRNQGGLAGASQVHPHSQIVAAAIIPYHVRAAIYEAQRYYDELGKCVFCDMIKNEIREQERIVLQNEKFIAFVPYAAMVPYETWIFPLQHETTFADLQPSEIRPLAQILRDVLVKFYHSLGNPAYNYCIRSVPHYSAGEPYYHWYIQILPRITTIAGFEIGSGININIALPEESAKFLREFKVK